MILIPEGGKNVRDTIAIKLGDERCRWVYAPDDPIAIPAAIAGATPMWTDEVAGLEDIPEPGPLQVYKCGIAGLDRHGFRITLPAFMPSVLLRQLLVNLWRLHGWKFQLTAFEEKVKPRYQHNFRRHLIGKPFELWTEAARARPTSS